MGWGWEMTSAPKASPHLRQLTGADVISYSRLTNQLETL